MQARDIMTPEPVVITARDRISEAAHLMRTHDVGMIPVVDDRATMRLEGVLTDRDIAVRCVAERHDGKCDVRDHMTAGTLDTVPPEADVHDVLARMERDQVRRIPVVDGRGRIVGIIAQADIATKLGPTEPLEVELMLEEISGRTHLVS